MARVVVGRTDKCAVEEQPPTQPPTTNHLNHHGVARGRSAAHLLSDGDNELAEALNVVGAGRGLVRQQLLHAAVDDAHCQQAALEQQADELDVAQHAPPGLELALGLGGGAGGARAVGR